MGEVAGNDNGTDLKARQYAQSEAYADAVWGSTIGSITDQVEARLNTAPPGGAPAPAVAVSDEENE